MFLGQTSASFIIFIFSSSNILFGSSTPVNGGINCVFKAITDFINPAIPAAAFVCPIFGFIDPIIGIFSFLFKRYVKALSSTSSPTGVPVPCPSKKDIVFIL